MKSTMKRSYCLRIIRLSILMILLLNPLSTAFASGTAVTASAIVVPAQVSQLGFTISGIAREIPVKVGDAVTTGQTLMVLDAPDLQFAVVEAQAALHAAQLYADLQKYQKVKDRRNGKIFYDTLPEVYLQRADARVQQAQVTLEVAEINFAESTLTAPFDGMIASIEVIPGELVQSDQTVVTLATLNNLQIETTDLSERDINKIKLGAPVSIFIEALNETVNGEVVNISPVANNVSGDIVFKVTIAFDEQPDGLLWGMTAEATIE